jgi:nicotinate-nucleotide adenylyltransferase
VLLAPTGRQPLKPDGAPAPFSDRLAMVRLLCDGVRGLEASELDGPRPDNAPNYTVDTLRRLRAGPDGLADARIFVIVGADAFLDLPRWREPEALLREAEWIVVSRPGFTEEELRRVTLAPHDAGRIHLLTGIEVPVSATEVRERIRQGLDCSGLLIPAVQTYIETHHLYRG